MTRVAAIDCGTNSIRLLVADVDPTTGSGVDVVRQMEVVRLGQGVDRTGRLAPEALERTFAALTAYQATIRASGASRVRMVATSATRDAANRAEFVAGVSAIIGVPPEIITGVEEAALSFTGAVRQLGAIEARPPFLVVDIGGGSTEFVLGTDSVDASRSVDIGCVRLTERHLHADPPSPAQVAAARSDIDAALDIVADDVPLRSTATLVGVAGTVTTVVAMALGLPAYDSERIHLARISAGNVAAVAQALRGMTRGERSALPFMHPGRVDVIVAGALILELIVARVGAPELVASEHDILDGMAVALARSAPGGGVPS